MNVVQLAWRNLVRKRRQTLQNAFGVALSIATLIAVFSLVRGSLHQAVVQASQDDAGQVTVYAHGYFAQARRAPLDLVLTRHAPLLAVVRRAPGVVSATPRLRFIGLLLDGRKSLPVRVIGLELDPMAVARAEPAAAAMPAALAGTITMGHGPRGHGDVVLGRPLARLLRVRVGGYVGLLATDGQHGTPCQRRFRIAGLFESGLPVYDDRVVLMALADAQTFLGLPGAATEIAISVADPARSPAIAKSLAARLATLSSAALETIPWQEASSDLIHRVQNGEKLINLATVGMLVSAVASMMNTIVMSVAERTREIGTMRALGMHSREVARLFLVEGALLGGLGSAVGMALGGGGLWALDAALRHSALLTGPMGQILAFEADAGVLLAFGGLGVLASVLAYAQPARMAAKLDPVEALRR